MHRAWRFSGYGGVDSYRFFIDTNSGQLIAVENRIYSADVWGTVSGHARPCCPETDPGHPDCCAADTTPQEGPLPGVQVSAIAGFDPPLCPSDEGTIVAQDLTCEGDQAGHYEFALNLPVRVTSRLIGEWATVVDCGRDWVDCSPAPNPTCWLDDVPDLLEDGAGLLACEGVEQPGQVDLSFNPVPDDPDVAQVTIFRAIEETHDWFKALQPSFTGIDVNLIALANVDITNAFYSGYPRGLGFGIAGPCGYCMWDGTCWWNCKTFALPTIVSHEYGHFIHDVLLDVPDRRFAEGVADTVSSVVWETQYQGYNMFDFNPEHPRAPFVRDIDYTDESGERDVLWEYYCDPVGDYDCLEGPPDECVASFPPDCIAPNNLCASHHCRSIALSGAFWDLRKEIGAQDTERLFADFLFITDGGFDPSVVLELLIVDDDDGNLLTTPPTPHYQEIIDSFVDKHKWPYMQCVTQVHPLVSWVGPPGEPETYPEGDDYFVYWAWGIKYDPLHQSYECVPNVMLRTTQKDGHPVWMWTIGHVWAPYDLGTIYAKWDELSDNNIIVEVGTDPTGPYNVDVVDIPAQSDDKWSSIRLNVTGDVGRAQCYPVQVGPDEGDGGRISGSVSGKASRVLAAAIGEGDFQSGTLNVNQLYNLDIETMPLGSLLSASQLYGSVTVAEELHGNMEVVAVQYWPEEGKGGTTHIQGGGESTGDITVTSSLAGGQVLIDGAYAGTLAVDGSMAIIEGVLDRYVPRIQIGELRGTVEIQNDLVGIIAIVGDGLSSTGCVVVHGSIDNEGAIQIERDMSGSILVNHIDTEGIIEVSVGRGDASGDIDVVGDIEGDIKINGDMSGNVLVGSRIVGSPSFGSVEIDGNMSGDILVGAVIQGTVEIHGDMSGDIVVGGLIQGIVEIHGNMSGDISAQYIESPGSVRIGGVFNGDICANNLDEASPLPYWIDIVFGADATICGEPACPHATGYRYSRLLFVDVDVAGSTHDGSTWQTAYTELQDAIDQAAAALPDATDIWVAEGTYRPTDLSDPADPRSATFLLTDRILVHGAFASGEARRCERDSTAYATILSGDLNCDDQPGFVNNDDNAYHVVTMNLTGSTGVLDGFTITGANADGSGPNGWGGGIQNGHGSPTIAGCVFRENSAYLGGAIYNLTASPKLTNCLFTGNRSIGGSAGAIKNLLDSNPNLINCTFSENSAPYGFGGAIRNDGESAPVLTNCILWGNTDSTGTGMSAQISSDSSSVPVVTYSCIQDDQPDDGIVYPCTSLPCSGGTGNIDVHPQFLDPKGSDTIAGTEDDDLHLYASSPCIETGDNSVVTVDTDLDGNPRQHDADGDSEKTVDMGAFELQCVSVESPSNPPAGQEAGFAKNRYLSFVPGSAGEQTELRVSLTATEIQGFGAAVGRKWWVGEPARYCENSGKAEEPVQGCPPAPGLPSRTFTGAELPFQCIPRQMDWHGVCDHNVCVGGLKEGQSCQANEDCAGVLHVFGQRVVPSAWDLGPPRTVLPTVYEVQAIHGTCDKGVERNFSAPLVMTMPGWGDVVGQFVWQWGWLPPDGSVDITKDVTAVLDKFKNLEYSPIKARCDVEPEVVNQLVEIADVTRVHEAFQGQQYPFNEPSACP